MKNWLSTLLSVVVAAVVAYTVATTGKAPVGHFENASDASYQRILEKKAIRCGYVVYPPGLIKDPNTKRIYGIFPETLEAAANDLGYKIEWVEEVGWATMIEGLRQAHYDAVCSPTWANTTRAQFVEFTTPLFFSGIGVYVRADDRRFDGHLQNINDANVALATIDGEMTSIVASQDYPNARVVALPQNSDVSQVLLNIINRKADVTFVEPYIAEQFLKAHPGSLRNIAAEQPVRIFPNTMMVTKGAYKLKGLLDVMLAEMINSGRADRLIAKYDLGSGTFYPLARPYRQPLPAVGK